MKEKTYVDDIDRIVYDIKDKENDAYKVKAGLTPEIVEKISKEKNDPAWMQQFRLQSLQIYNSLQVPNWGPDIEDLDMDNICLLYTSQEGTAFIPYNHLHDLRK